MPKVYTSANKWAQILSESVWAKFLQLYHSHSGLENCAELVGLQGKSYLCEIRWSSWGTSELQYLRSDLGIVIITDLA